MIEDTELTYSEYTKANEVNVTVDITYDDVHKILASIVIDKLDKSKWMFRSDTGQNVNITFVKTKD